MSELAQERCVACRADSPRVGDGEIAGLLAELPEWRLVEEQGVKQLERRLPFADFAEALAFSIQVGEIAESEGHHPRIVTEWGGATVSWWTHKIRGLHRNDFVMAAKTDRLYVGEPEDLQAG